MVDNDKTEKTDDLGVGRGWAVSALTGIVVPGAAVQTCESEHLDQEARDKAIERDRSSEEKLDEIAEKGANRMADNPLRIDVES